MAPLVNFSETDFAFTCALARTIGGIPPALKLVGKRWIVVLSLQDHPGQPASLIPGWYEEQIGLT